MFCITFKSSLMRGRFTNLRVHVQPEFLSPSKDCREQYLRTCSLQLVTTTSATNPLCSNLPPREIMQLLLGVAKCLIDSPMLLAPEKKSDYEASIVARSSAPTLFVQKREICDFAIVKIGLRQNAIIYLGFVVLPL